jgi:hypothetical protein
MLTPELISIAQKIECRTQMQWTNKEYLESGRSIYAVWSIDEEEDCGPLFHGTYTDYNTLPDFLSRYNGCHIDVIARVLHENEMLDDDEYAIIQDFIS